eukprot:5378325-Pyramimonas_sp.AAC.1
MREGARPAVRLQRREACREGGRPEGGDAGGRGRRSGPERPWLARGRVCPPRGVQGRGARAAV